MDGGPVEALLLVAVETKVWRIQLKELDFVRLVGFVAGSAHPGGGRWMLGFLVEHRGAVTVSAHIISGQQAFPRAGVRAVTGRAHPPCHGHVYGLLS